MKEKSIAIVICSRLTSEDNKDFIDHVKTTCGCECHFFYLINPDGVALSKIYDDIMQPGKINDKIVVFIHDDVEFLKPGWGKEVIRLFNDNKDYGIIGVAGSAQFDENAAWWRYDKKYGQILHRSNGKSWLTAFSPLLNKDLEEVCVIDGVFMAVHRDRITKGFSPDLEGFDFYDITFCLDNYLDGKTKIGVTTNIRMCHKSVGELKPGWYINRELINEKYKEYYPIEVQK